MNVSKHTPYSWHSTQGSAARNDTVRKRALTELNRRVSKKLALSIRGSQGRRLTQKQGLQLQLSTTWRRQELNPTTAKHQVPNPHALDSESAASCWTRLEESSTYYTLLFALFKKVLRWVDTNERSLETISYILRVLLCRHRMRQATVQRIYVEGRSVLYETDAGLLLRTVLHDKFPLFFFLTLRLEL